MLKRIYLPRNLKRCLLIKRLKWADGRECCFSIDVSLKAEENDLDYIVYCFGGATWE